ncbi:unnamed protein product [Ranitomeya imitator]|uniref:Laminin G domain-containing protein n=1 Tax=Ranitomeya imitator TaxID=111125 RepID=A0ABN9KUH0_9NEOB|nr:unnamed protein product [Ranitomeya imitator]
MARGRYVSITAHWVNVVDSGSTGDSKFGTVLPSPRSSKQLSVAVRTPSSSSSSSSSCRSKSSSTDRSRTNTPSAPATVAHQVSHYGAATGIRQQAVLAMKCLGDNRHTAEVLSEFLQQETQSWLGTVDLEAGKVVEFRNQINKKKKNSLSMAHTFTVQVDEDKNQTLKLPASHTISVKKLFVGGIPSDVQFPMYKNIPPFEGCIWDLLINAVPIDFAQPVSFENADIGQCLTDEEVDLDENGALPLPGATKSPQIMPSPPGPVPSTEPDTSEEKSANITDEHDSATGCAPDIRPEIIQEENSLGFPKTATLHLHLMIPNLSIELELRTTADSGLIFYMARINHADFATIQIKDGMAHFRYDLGSGDTTTMVPKKVNDGEWHKEHISLS